MAGLPGLDDRAQAYCGPISTTSPGYGLYKGQKCTDNLRYEIVKDGTKKNRAAGKQCNMTVAAFAAWASGEFLE